MCGIVGVVRRRARRADPDARALARSLGALTALLDGAGPVTERLSAAADLLESVDAALRGAPGVRALLGAPDAAEALATTVDGCWARLDELERALDAGEVPTPDGDALEAVNSALTRARDAAWAVGRERLRTAAAVTALGPTSPTSVDAYLSIQVALAALDRLEVRGRDSAGLHVLVRDHGLDVAAPDVAELLAPRLCDPLFESRSVRVTSSGLSFVYKAAAEIGELGDNTAVLRSAIRDDELLRRALTGESSQALVLGHTRWASVGSITEANAHPLNQEEPDRDGAPYVIGALNGDVDNFADLGALEHLHFAREITTDAKVIPALVSRRLQTGTAPDEAFRATVASLEGSLATAAQIDASPGELFLSLRGSGQALYVGLAEDEFVVASEPYGLVEETARYLRMDGETPADPARASASRGQVVILDAERAGTVEGIRRQAFDGTALPVSTDDLSRAEITTRDIDRGAFPHFLLKELSEAPASFRKTLRGRIVEGDDGRLRVTLAQDVLSDELVARLRAGGFRRVVAIGQGTAAIAAQGVAATLSTLVGSRIRADAMAATELSGFDLAEDMSDTIVVAISQSGTTTDTNRTVDLARARSAAVIAIVNRRNSDLVDKSDGVLYTSDGRDLEMAVPSTKAFYAQIAAGYLLALAIASTLGELDPAHEHERLSELRALPDAMDEVLLQRDTISAIAQRHVPSRRYWTVVGNGLNRIAANELRIKLSELCYRSISADIAEDKKHIDLCTEPLILVCAVGLRGSNADDVAKEVAYHRAHRAAPIVITTQGEERFASAVEIVEVPPVHPDLGFVLSAMAGHLFGYEAALVIDASARILRSARGMIQDAAADGDFAALARDLTDPATAFLDVLRAGDYDGNLTAATAVRVASLFRYATGIMPLDLYEVDHGKVGTPLVVADDLTAALTDAIDELTRTIDTIKHQAKTVTVGISRADEELLLVPLVREVLAAGAARDVLSYRALRTLVALDPAVERVTAWTRYRIEGDLAGDAATIHVVDTTANFASLTTSDPTLRGTKHRVATQREVTVARGRDGRTLVFVPEVKGNQTVGMTLLHADFAPRLAPDAARSVLQGYQGRYGALKDAVTETVPAFDDSVLGDLDVFELLTEPVYVMARRWPNP
ncbi:MAG TPA: SIS domain-containing protein [Acidimicrobiia bacterium]|jgi:glucosamine--fructose-6-phosphate aminotransferase (isomerizing)